MTKTWLLPMVLSLSIGVPACHRANKAEQLAALDSAYQSGILTKEEYEAKRRALLGPPPAAPSVKTAPAPVAGPVAQPQNPAPPAAPAPPGQMAKTRENPSAGAQPEDVTQDSDAARTGPEAAPSSGCEDAQYKSGKEKGTQERFFPMPMAKVKKAAAAALKALDFNIKRDGNHEIEASKKRHIGALVGAGGERVILHFKDAQQGGQNGTRVTGETRKTFVGRVAQKSWTNAVLAQTTCILREDDSRR